MNLKKFNSFISEGYTDGAIHAAYLKWKRKNVTLRGVKELGKENGTYGSYGRGLYTAYLSYKKLASNYGKVYFVVNGKPKNPYKVQWSSQLEVFFQKYKDINEGVEALKKMGYDGVAIEGREYCYYGDTSDVLYFEADNEERLKNYFYDTIYEKNPQ